MVLYYSIICYSTIPWKPRVYCWKHTIST